MPHADTEITQHAAVSAVDDLGGAFDVHLGAADERSCVRAGAVILANGSPAAAAALLGAEAPWSDPGPATTAACLDLALRRHPAQPLVLGLDAPVYLSVHNPPAKLGPAGTFVVHAMRYGARSAEQDRPALDALVARGGIRVGDIIDCRFLARMVVSQGTPLAGRGMAGRPGHVIDQHPGLFIAGDWVGPHGLLADAAMASGRSAALAGVAVAATTRTAVG